MKILITGGTGLIGRALCRELHARGCTLTVLSRAPATVAEKCGGDVTALASLDDWRAGDAFDAVVNLAGAPIADRRWTAKRKRVLWSSRVTITEKLAAKIATVESPPRALISASAVGYYGDTGAREVDESAPPGSDFGAKLCVAWEAAAAAIESTGVRVCIARTGIVLSRSGGMLTRMLPVFKFGLGARIGGGEQYLSWIHIDDYIDMLCRLLFDDAHRGAYNLCAPAAVTNAEFTVQLARALHRPAVLRAPAVVIKAALGEASLLLLGGQRVTPARLLAAGHPFRYATLDDALAALIKP